MLEVLSDILLACKSSPQPKRALGQSGVGGGLERDEKPREGQEERRRLVGWQGTTARIFS